MNDITHICLFDIPMLCSIPGLIYLAPTTCEEYFAMLRWSILQDKKAIAIRVPSNGVVHTSDAVDGHLGHVGSIGAGDVASLDGHVAASSFAATAFTAGASAILAPCAPSLRSVDDALLRGPGRGTGAFPPCHCR